MRHRPSKKSRNHPHKTRPHRPRWQEASQGLSFHDLYPSIAHADDQWPGPEHFDVPFAVVGMTGPTQEQYVTLQYNGANDEK